MIVPALSLDGSIDPKFLDEVGSDWILDWLSRRFDHEDPYFPMTPDQDRAALIVYLLERYGRSREGMRSIGAAITTLLVEGRTAVTQRAKRFDESLRIAQRTLVPAARSFFYEELERAATDSFASDELWGAQRQQGILIAATRHASGSTSEDARRFWLLLLQRPTSSSIALAGLASDTIGRLRYLPTWWENVSVSTRKRDLRSIIARALRQDDDGTSLRVLKELRSVWPPDLRDAAGAALQGLEYANSSSVTLQGSAYDGALTGAATYGGCE